MGTLSIFLWIMLVLIVAFFIVEFSNKLFDGDSIIIDHIILKTRNLIKLIKKQYGNFRQRFCKKSTEINADRGTVQDNAELYDSSSVWED